MQNSLRIAAITGFMLLTSCTGGSDVSQEFIDACMKESNMGEELCECISELAAEELTPEGVAFLTASMNDDKEGARKLVNEMSVAESAAAGMFMLNGPARCAEDMPEPE